MHLWNCAFFDNVSLPRYLGDMSMQRGTDVRKLRRYHTSRNQHKQDIVFCVRNYLTSNTLTLNIRMRGIGIKHIRPDICALLIDNHIVGEVEVKLPGQGILEYETVVGEFYDQMMLARGFYWTSRLCGILTSGRVWRVFWFPEEDFSVSRDHQKEGYITPANSCQGGYAVVTQSAWWDFKST